MKKKGGFDQLRSKFGDALREEEGLGVEVREDMGEDFGDDEHLGYYGAHFGA